VNVLLFICQLGDLIVCEDPIHVIFDTDWTVFWLNIGFTALITAGAVVLGIFINDLASKRKLKKTTKIALKREITDVLTILENKDAKDTGHTFDDEYYSYTPYRFEPASYQSLVGSGSLLHLDVELQGFIRDGYSLMLEHNYLISEIDKLSPNALLYEVYKYRDYMGYIEGLQVNLSGLEQEMIERFKMILDRLG
jgi:hypothetical protein